MIDASVLSDTNYIKNIGLEPECNLDSIAKNITVDNKKYILRGIVNYLSNMRHYTVLLNTSACWYEYDDLKSKRTQLIACKLLYNVVPYVILYAQIQ